MNSRISTFLIVGMLLCSLLVVLNTDNATSYEIEKFGNPGNPTERIIKLSGPSGEEDTSGSPQFKDATTFLDLPIGKDVILPDSSLKIGVVDTGDGKYALNPSVDVGMDGDLEWTFQGVGYGKFGYQTYFNDGSPKKTMKYLSDGINTNVKVKIPKDAQVSSAKIDVGGRFSEPTFQQTELDDSSLDNPRGMHVVDLDLDGDNDIVVANYGGSSVYWYENPLNPSSGDPGDKTQWEAHKIGDSLTNPYNVAVGDFNSDLFPDVAVTCKQYYFWGGAVSWFTNPREDLKVASSWNQSDINYQWYYPDGIAAGDIDGDGDDDILVTEYYRYTLIYIENTKGDGTSWSVRTARGGLNYYPTDISLGDLNNDGILDAAVGCYYQRTGSTGIQVIQAPANPGAGTWTAVTIENTIQTFQDTFMIDLNRDGYDDVIGTTERHGVYWYLNPGEGGSTWKKFTIYSSVIGGSSIWVDDIGNDGYYDIIASSGSGSYGGSNILWLEQPDDPELGTSWDVYTVDSGITNPRGVFIADIDNANLLDIVAVSYGSDVIRWYTATMSYPSDVEMDVGEWKGNSATHDFEYPGVVKDPVTTGNLAPMFNNILNDVSTPWETDAYGNNITDIYFSVRCPGAGRVKMYNVDITYTVETKIEKNPHNGHLYNELNEIIPDYGVGNYSVPICVQSYTPATLRLSGAFIKYNSPPKLEKEIESTYHVLESKSNSHLIDLYEYFSDDYDAVEDLSYRVEYNSNTEKVWALIANSRYVKVAATKDDDWYGKLTLQVSATDTMGLKTLSNKFEITVDNDDDPPYIGNELPNFEIPEGQTTYLMNLNNSKYFSDDDSDKLFYRGLVDETYRSHLNIHFDKDLNMYATAYGDWYESNVPVQIYCDDENLDVLTYDDLENMEVFQDIIINVVNVNDGPKWLKFPESISIEEDYRMTHGGDFKWVNLNEYVTDIDNTEFDFTYSVSMNTNSSYIKVTVDRQDYVHIDNALVENYNGQSDVMLRVSDGALYADVLFTAKTIPINDRPSISIHSPSENSVVAGEVSILGKAYDLEGLEKVMVSINDGAWTKATGTTNWQYTWNTATIADGQYTLAFKAYDNDENDKKISDSAILHLRVYNALMDTDGDGYFGEDDKFPDEPTQWSDADDDGYGDNPEGFNPDAFPEDPLEWFDSDGDGYGNRQDKFPFDATQWNDSDDDGYGDNIWGNDPDPNPNNDKVPALSQETQEKESDESDFVLDILWYAVFIVFVLIILVSIAYARFYNPKEK
ncbi:MAG: VCBS repeat-containing protein [Thermoplasmata archaeon]|nr:MAG: VCBS repeat-containing protein [Thermoplasmata archaeon]